MKTFRIVLGILAILPVALILAVIIVQSTGGDDSALELLSLIFGVPILILNLWAWGYPPLIEYYFFGKDIEDK